jgi:nucleoside-diphosphate-sugar epimerase
MKALFIGGTGNISLSVSRLALYQGWDLYLLNRGIRETKVDGAHHIRADVYNNKNLADSLRNHLWDVVVDWIAFTEEDIERDLELFRGKTKQFIFISSASAYQKPLSHPIVRESTPLFNPYWQYSRDKIACEMRLMKAYREEGFPVTIVRPSLTYSTVIPVALGGWQEYTVVDRMKRGKKIIVHGDGTSLWTITHAEDFAKGFFGLMSHPQAIGQDFHITSDELFTWNQIYQMLADAVGVPPNIVHIPSEFICTFDPEQTGNLLGDKAHSVIFDNTKIKTLVPGFQATIPFHQGIRGTLAWLDKDPKRKWIRPETDMMMDKIIRAYEMLRAL